MSARRARISAGGAAVGVAGELDAAEAAEPHLVAAVVEDGPRPAPVLLEPRVLGRVALHVDRHLVAGLEQGVAREGVRVGRALEAVAVEVDRVGGEVADGHGPRARAASRSPTRRPGLDRCSSCGTGTSSTRAGRPGGRTGRRRRPSTARRRWGSRRSGCAGPRRTRSRCQCRGRRRRSATRREGASPSPGRRSAGAPSRAPTSRRGGPR